MIRFTSPTTMQYRTRHCFLVGSLFLSSSYRYLGTTVSTTTPGSGTAFVAGLNIALITGNSRKDGPPQPILGPRVAAFIQQGLERRGNTVTVLDPNLVESTTFGKTTFCLFETSSSTGTPRDSRRLGIGRCLRYRYTRIQSCPLSGLVESTESFWFFHV